MTSTDTRQSYYVNRAKDGRRSGWVGPIRSRNQAIKEAQAWQDSGWDAAVFVSDPNIRAAVRAWQKAVRADRGW